MGDAVEAIARVNHDRWAAERIFQGWRYGEERDDARKLHPDLVPYELLSEAEKRIDVEGAKAIIAELIRLGILRQ
ncbi:MAG: Ryanodine receptor Ryr [Proteobacteria bacterium]|nr:Ryanodine receptor Ryr [Pseudomonadota bacterium]MBU4294334.1 Ryanodine receptor Ryr [Pseudomonadota bacterium]